MNTKPLKILISLFIINTLSFYLFFSSHPNHFHLSQNHHPLPQNHHTLKENHYPLTQNHHTLQQNHHPFEENDHPLRQNQNHNTLKQTQNHLPLTENRLPLTENHQSQKENRHSTENHDLTENHSSLTENHHNLTENNHILTEINHNLTENRLSLTENHLEQKPWPILPSYLPWGQNPQVKIQSCEAFFGNGFTRRLEVLAPTPEIRRKTVLGSSGGWFRCLYSETLRSSVCEGAGIRMWPEKIKMTKGGEKVETVIGRSEDDEIPVFEDGAFDVFTGDLSRRGKKLVKEEFLADFISKEGIERHSMMELIGSIRVVGGDGFECSEWIEEPTLLLTRFEYANVFHTFTDFYSAYVASRVTGLPNRPHLLFVDGHCETQLEETWQVLFSSVRYVKHFSGPVCFRHAILTPLGYETAMFKGLSENIDCRGASAHDLWENPDDQSTARLSEFGEMIRAAFGFPVDRHRMVKPSSGHNILFVRREDYLAHPRHGGKIQNRLSNEAEIFEAVNSWVSDQQECKLNMVNGRFAHMPMKEQVRAIQDASVIIGAHGAGLTHIVSAMPKTVILEIISSEYRRPHFALIAQWKGLEYHPIYLSGSYAQPKVVIDKLHEIVTSLEC